MPKVVLAKPGLDGHEAGVLLVARALLDAGMEVIYLGPRQTADAIVQAALEEDADLIGLSILTGGHLTHTQLVLRAMRAAGLEGLPLVVGGILSPASVAKLTEMGVAATFGPGEPLHTIVSSIRHLTS